MESTAATAGNSQEEDGNSLVGNSLATAKPVLAPKQRRVATARKKNEFSAGHVVLNNLIQTEIGFRQGGIYLTVNKSARQRTSEINDFELNTSAVKK